MLSTRFCPKNPISRNKMLYTYIVYNSILLFVVVFAYLLQKSSNRISEYGFRTLLFLTMAIPACIRRNVGTDYWNYVELYQLYSKSGDSHEIGFVWIGQFMNWLGFHYQFFIILLAVLAIVPICYYVPKRNCSSFIIIFFFLNYLDIMGTSRQQISIALITCGIFALYHNRGSIKYLFANVMAFLFHYSSALYVPLLFFKNIRITPRKAYISLACVVAATMGGGMIEWLFGSSLFLDSPYGVYVTSGYNTEANVGSGLGIIANLLLPFLFILFFKRIYETIPNSGFLCILTLIFIGSYILASQIHIFGRLINVFCFVPAFIAYPTCKAISTRYRKLVFAGFFLIYLVLYEKTISISQISLGNGLGISPFSTIFD